MNDIAKYLIGLLIGVIIVGGAIMLFAHPSDDTGNTDDSTIVDTVQEKVDSVSNGVNSTLSGAANSGSSSGSSQGAQSGVSGGQVSQNGQEGQGEIYQIDYNDGNFRQYDTKTGDLIGSSFDEDQSKLGVVDGNLE